MPKLLSYTRTGTTWAFKTQYFIGGFSGENSAGGVDFAYTNNGNNVSAICDDFFWASGNYMMATNFVSAPNFNLIYGLEGISYAGNNSVTATTPTANKDTDLFIDLDPNGNDKGGLGDVEVFDASACFDTCTTSIP